MPERLEATIPLPNVTRATVAVASPGPGLGHWAGAPSAATDDDGTVWLAYRLRRPVGAGRGYAVAIARSGDGTSFEEVARLDRDAFTCDSLERPTLVRRPDGGWRLYLSLATPGTLHWNVVAIDADRPDAFDPADAVPCIDLGPHDAIKDVVIHPAADGWEGWFCLHQVADPGSADAMRTLHATSADGLTWTVDGTAMAPTDPDGWDRRGTRLAAVVTVGSQRWAYYDGRASAEENWEERTGIAVESADGRFAPLPDGPHASSPHTSGALRYVAAIAVDGGLRLFYEASAEDGSHELLTEYAPLPS